MTVFWESSVHGPSGMRLQHLCWGCQEPVTSQGWVYMVIALASRWESSPNQPSFRAHLEILGGLCGLSPLPNNDTSIHVHMQTLRCSAVNFLHTSPLLRVNLLGPQIWDVHVLPESSVTIIISWLACGRVSQVSDRCNPRLRMLYFLIALHT